MNKWIIGIIAVVFVAIAGLVILMLNQPQPTTPSTETGAPQTDVPSDQSGETPATTDTVTISGMAFSPSKITVKKGTTITWTNQDGVGHNVVSTSAAPAGGPPTEAPLLSKGESFSFTYDTVGTFPYVCAPHAATMRGTVEVVE